MSTIVSAEDGQALTLEPCPHCASRRLKVNGCEKGPFWITCLNDNCGADGPIGLTIYEAVFKYNQRLEF